MEEKIYNICGRDVEGKLTISFGSDFVVHLSPDEALKLASDILKRLDVVMPN